MPTLREIIDGTVLAAAGIAPAAPPPGNAVPKGKGAKGNGKNGNGKGSPSPLAKHISDHLQDTVGATKEGFTKLQDAKTQYDMQREEMQRNLAPVQSVLDHVSQLHNLDTTPGAQIDPLAPYQDPNQMGGPGSNAPGSQDAAQGYDKDGNPVNMNQTVGKMNQSRPSLVGHQPGVAPGPAQSVVPGKKGLPQPGQGNSAGRAGMPSQPNAQFGPQAAPPKGNRSMPGAKGPGDPKVANKTNKAQNNSSRQIKVHVSAASAIPVIKASSTIETQFGIAMLRSTSIKAGGPGSGRHAEHGTFAKTGKAGESTYYKGGKGTVVRVHEPNNPGKATRVFESIPGETHSETQIYKNYTSGGASQGNDFSDFMQQRYGIKASGTMKGGKKGWSTRGKGTVSPKEKEALYETMDSAMMAPPRGGVTAPISRGPSVGVNRGTPSRGEPMRPAGGARVFSKKMKSGAEQVNDKDTDSPGNTLALNPVIRSKGKHMKDCECAKCKGMQAGGPGSGRRQGGGGGRWNKPVNQVAHARMLRRGYTYKGNAHAFDIGMHSRYEKMGPANKYGTGTLSKSAVVTKDGKVSHMVK